jgi:phytoene dehydrogenase-like protein
MAEQYDAIVVGAGPNGLTASSYLASLGLRVLVVEADQELGGGVRSGQCTLPGFVHDICSAVHTMGCLSPAFNALGLERQGLEWIYPSASVAHPLDGQSAVLLAATLDETLAGLDASDRARFVSLVRPFMEHGTSLIGDLLAPLGWPTRPLALLEFGLNAVRSARSLAFGAFKGERARALFAGCAAHSIQPLESWLTAAFGVIFLGAAQIKPWPIARGGSGAIARALERVNLDYGVEFRTAWKVNSVDELPAAKAYLFDLAPRQVAHIAGAQLPRWYVKALQRYRMGPAVFKLDYALSEPTPWLDPACARASTIHLGGTFDEIARSEREMWNGEASQAPYIIFAQQSLLDSSRAPLGQHTGYAYCHVPSGCTTDMTAVIERQIERFAPGFGDTILARKSWSPSELERHNSSYVGGAITGGVADMWQLYTRPTLSLRPYSTPNPRLYLCSQSTPPGGGVHGMCGYYAARTVARRVFGKRLPLDLPASSRSAR